MENTRIHHLLKPLTSLLKIFSMLPLTLSDVSSTRRYLAYVNTVGVLTLLLANFTGAMVTLETSSESSLSLLIRYLVTGLSVIFVLVTLYKAHSNRRLFQAMVREVDEMSRRSIGRNKNLAMSYKPNYRHLHSRIQLYCLLFLLSIFTSYEVINRFLPNLTFCSTSNFLVSSLYSLLLGVEFYLLLSLVQHRLEKMYEYFQGFNQDTTHSLLITDHTTHSSHLSTENVKSELIYLLKSFYSVFSICSKINALFSAQILLVLILSHVLLTCIVFVMTQTIITCLSTQEGLAVDMICANVYWFGFCWVVITLLVVPCENIASLKRNILETVHQIIIEDKMPELTLQLEMFLLDIQNYKIQFTAHGFFSLEYSLIRKIIGAVATYWILLIQFQ